MHLTLYNESYDVFCRMLPNHGASILEIGCGPGNITNYIAQKLPHLQILATDVSPQMVALAQKNLPHVTFKVLDAREIVQLTERFNAVICGFCIPYLEKEDVARMFINFNQLLKPNGVIYLSTIEGEYSQSKLEYSSDSKLSTFVHYYSEKEITDELIKNQFSISEIIRIPYLKRDGKHDTHLVFIAKKLI